MSRRKISTTIYITPDQADRLKLLHDRTKVPIAVYIREGIDMVLKHYEHMLPGQMTFETSATHANSTQASSAQANSGQASSAQATLQGMVPPAPPSSPKKS